MHNPIPEGYHVEIHAPSERVYHWHGAHTVNIYVGGEEVDVFTLGTADEPSFAEVVESIERHEADAEQA